jgi:hypothetical protein
MYYKPALLVQQILLLKKEIESVFSVPLSLRTGLRQFKQIYYS